MFDRVKQQERFKAIDRASSIAPRLPEGSKDGDELSRGEEDEEHAHRRQERRERDKMAEQLFTLERATGVRARKSVTAGDMKQRFAILKHAPVEANGSATDKMKLSFNPVGVTLRNVRCSRCKQWGHQVGDRECSLRHELTNRDMENIRRDDPMTHMPRDEPVYGNAHGAAAASAGDDLVYAKQLAYGVSAVRSTRDTSTSMTDPNTYITEGDAVFQAAQVATAQRKHRTHKERHERHHSKRRRQGSSTDRPSSAQQRTHRSEHRHDGDAYRHKSSRRSSIDSSRRRGVSPKDTDALLKGMSRHEKQLLLADILQKEGDHAAAHRIRQEAQHMDDGV